VKEGSNASISEVEKAQAMQARTDDDATKPPRIKRRRHAFMQASPSVRRFQPNDSNHSPHQTVHQTIQYNREVRIALY